MTEPVVTVLPTEDPETMPQSAEEMTATLAGPPEDAPATQLASWMKKSEMPVHSRKDPKMMKTTINFAQTWIGVVRMPVVR